MASVRMRRIAHILRAVRDLAVEYYEETGKPLGITAEVAEFEAARLLGLKLSQARQEGYDAIRGEGVRPRRVQIKGRCIPDESKGGQRVGAIKLDKKWDSVVLVLLDREFRPVEIYEARRPAIKRALMAPGSKARNERGALSVSKFKSIGERVWPKR